MLQLLKNQLKKVWLAYMTRMDRRKRSVLGLGSGYLPPDLWSVDINEAGHLAIGGVDAVSLADTYGTPLYVCDRDRLLHDYREFITCFKRYYPHVEVDYSYKTNPLPGVLKVLHGDGAGAEVISPFELWLALSLGVPPSQITFNGPAKTDGGIETAVREGIRLINIDNVDEVNAIQSYAEQYG